MTAASTSILGVTRPPAPLRESVIGTPVDASADSICAGVSAAFACTMSAAVAAAIGEACEVP